MLIYGDIMADASVAYLSNMLSAKLARVPVSFPQSSLLRASHTTIMRLVGRVADNVTDILNDGAGIFALPKPKFSFVTPDFWY